MLCTTLGLFMDEKVMVIDVQPFNMYVVQSVDCDDGYVWMVHEDQLGEVYVGS